jgi:hypothetical protein
LFKTAKRRILSKIKHPTRTSQKFHAWDDGWMDGSSLIQKWSLKKKLMGISKIKTWFQVFSTIQNRRFYYSEMLFEWDRRVLAKTNAQPTLLQKSMPGMMDGWMDLPPPSSQGRAYEQLLEYYTHHKLPSWFTCGCVLHICRV